MDDATSSSHRCDNDDDCRTSQWKTIALSHKVDFDKSVVRGEAIEAFFCQDDVPGSSSRRIVEVGDQSAAISMRVANDAGRRCGSLWALARAGKGGEAKALDRKSTFIDPRATRCTSGARLIVQREKGCRTRTVLMC